METSSASQFDVIVIGGGPGGCTTASFIAMQGHRVLLLERETFPRHQIGESLLPATVHGICGLLGVKEFLSSCNFTRKRGGTFRWGKSSEPWTFTFAENPDAPGGFAYQVERSKFDKILLDNCRRKGVDVKEAHRVNEILVDNGRAVGVVITDEVGKTGTARAKYIVDAGGYKSRQYNAHVGERVYSKFFRNVALYGYFENGGRLPAPNQGNIFSCAFADGWFWYIPLSEKLTSVGVVISSDRAALLQQGHEQALNEFIGACPPIRELLTGARRITEGMYGSLRLRKDYSYCNSRFWMPGLALVGDAACFVDPVFSSGVHLATYSGLLVARSINSCLRGSFPESLAFNEYEARYRREFANFYQFLLAFYDMHQDQDSYYWTARKILNTEESKNEAFVRLVSGRSSTDDAALHAPEFFQARAGLGAGFAAMVALKSDGAGGPRLRAPPPAIGHEAPLGHLHGLTDEIVQIQLQALFGESRPNETPAIGKLIPSRDGFHWARA